jgi:hypothetical protein
MTVAPAMPSAPSAATLAAPVPITTLAVAATLAAPVPITTLAVAAALTAPVPVTTPAVAAALTAPVPVTTPAVAVAAPVATVSFCSQVLAMAVGGPSCVHVVYTFSHHSDNLLLNL